MKRLVANNKQKYIADFERFLSQENIPLIPYSIENLTIYQPQQVIHYTDNIILSAYNKDFVDFTLTLTPYHDHVTIDLSLYIFSWTSNDEYRIDKREFVDFDLNGIQELNELSHSKQLELVGLILDAIKHTEISEANF